MDEIMPGKFTISIILYTFDILKPGSYGHSGEKYPAKRYPDKS
jgi:hypothetical protein